jgi:hypothetical protein
LRLQTKKLSEELRNGLLRGKDLGRAELGNERYAVVSVYDGSVRVHIRQYAGTGYPTKMGVSLSLDAWRTLTRNMAELSALIAETTESMEDGQCKDVKTFKVPLGDSVYLTYASDYRCVNVRRYFIPDGESVPVPTRWGLALKLIEWRALCEAVDFVNYYLKPYLPAEEQTIGVFDNGGGRPVSSFSGDDDDFNVPCKEGGGMVFHKCMETYMACKDCNTI